jgi:hypothetical protein
MRGGEMTVAVLDQVQVLDQEIALARAIAEQGTHFGERLGLDLAAFGRPARAVAPPRARSLIVGPRVHAWNPSRLTRTKMVDQKQARNGHQLIEILYQLCDTGSLP